MIYLFEKSSFSIFFHVLDLFQIFYNTNKKLKGVICQVSFDCNIMSPIIGAFLSTIIFDMLYFFIRKRNQFKFKFYLRFFNFLQKINYVFTFLIFTDNSFSSTYEIFKFHMQTFIILHEFHVFFYSTVKVPKLKQYP